jgi:AraC-like DNA-binding protein
MPAAYFKLALDLIGTTRARRQMLLDGTGLTVETLGDELTLGQQLRQVRNVNRMLPAGWGLAIGAHFLASTHGPLGFGAVSAPDLGAAVGLIERFSHVRNPSIEVRVRREGADLRLVLLPRCELLEEERLPLFENFLLSVQALLESVLGRELDCGRVEIAGRAAYPSLYRDHFHPEVRFDTGENALVIPASWVNRPSPFSDPGMHAACLRKLEEMEARLLGHSFAAARVAGLLVSGGDAGLPIELAAKSLGYSPRTLIRRLRESDITYRELRDAHRQRRAEILLRDSELTASEIAARLGYEEPSNFARACRRWFKSTPRKIRISLRGPAPQEDPRGSSRKSPPHLPQPSPSR